MRDNYRIALRPNTTSYYNIVGNQIPGAVNVTSTPYYLPNPPSGWDTVDVSRDRNTKYWGIDTVYSAEYKFIEEGAKILRHIWYKFGRKGKCLMQVEKLDTNTQQYVPFFTSDLDFTSARDGEEDGVPFFSIEILQSGVSGLLKTREMTEYEFWLHSTSPNVITVEVPSFKVGGIMKFMTSWPIPQQGTDTTAVEINNGVSHGRLYYLYYDKTVVADSAGAEPISFANAIFQTIGSSDSDNYGVLGQAPFGSSTPIYGGNFLFHAEKELYNVQFRGGVDVFIINDNGLAGDTFSLNIIKVQPGSTWSTIYSDSFNVPAGSSGTHTFSLNSTTIPPFTLAAGEEIEIYFRKHTASMAGIDQFYKVQWANMQSMDVIFEHYTDSFTFKAKRAHQVYKDLVSKASNNTAIGLSGLLTANNNYNQNWDLKPKNLVITSSNAICGISKPDPSITPAASAPTYKTTLANFFQAMNAVQSVGLGVFGNAVFLEKKSFFLDTTQVITTIDNPASVIITPATEWLYNKMKIGSENQTYDGLNGKDEFNTKQQWEFCKNFPLTDTDKELDLSNPYRTDMYGVFFTWLNNILLNKEGSINGGSNSSSTNDLFMIEVDDTPNGSGNYPVKTWPTTFVFNLNDAANSYNLSLSPKRCLLRNGRFLRSILYGLDQDFIKYVSMEKNSQLLSNFQSGNVDEDLDQLITQFWLGDPLFLPYIAEVECVSPQNFDDLYSAQPLGVIRVPWKGTVIEGFPLSVGVRPSYPEAEYTFRLLLSPNNNLEDLIY